jgi:16S rRNA (adenine1518-N6/adenine1519-N6)-dimethyltransferase
MIPVKPKKSLGQHFLTDKNIARKIVKCLSFEHYGKLLEIGPGTGVLSEILLTLKDQELKFVEIDRSAVNFLVNRYPGMAEKIITADILDISLETIYNEPFAIIGNFPYNISSQLFFKILDHRNLVIETVCMIQKEVAARIASPPGSRDYGILSVLLQAFYTIENLFSVPPHVFTPPPNVYSSVIRLRRNSTRNLECDEKLFSKVVKTAFNQRRKTLRNSLRNLTGDPAPAGGIWQKRPEQLGIDEFVNLTTLIAENESHDNH